MGYSSGTTGRPKGVRRPVLDLEPEMVIASGTAYLGGFGLVPGPGVHLVCSPLYHAAPCHFSLQALHLGHTIVIHRKFDAEAILADIERYQVTSTQMVPTHLHRMLRLPADVKGKHDLRSIQVMLVAGAPFPPEEKRAAIEWLGPVVWEYLAATGYLYLLDRRVDLIISGGVNLYPAEIEQRLVTHPAVADVAVVGVPHPDWGHQPVAVVQLEDGWTGGPDVAATLDAYCRDALASLKCPASYEFRESLPRTPSGKLLRRLLREELASHRD